MENQFHILKVTRKNVLNSINELTPKQLNVVPKGYKNNIIWNIAHIVVTQQLLCYGLSDNPMLVELEKIEENRKGSSPTKQYSNTEIECWKNLLSSTSDQLEKDYNNNLFKQFKQYPTSYNLELKSIEEAIEFNNIHEALHLGYIMALKKIIS